MTQLESAVAGVVTKEMKVVAEKERMDEEVLRSLVASGKVVIPCNRQHTSISPEGIGKRLRTKVNVNLGTSKDVTDYDSEIEKVNRAIRLGAESIMDLSTHGDTRIFRRKLIETSPVMIGTVPIYDSVIHHQKDLGELTAQDFLDTIRLHAQDGVDFITIHSGITRKTIDQIKNHKRLLNIVSRGGSLVFAWMSMTGHENPFYEYFDEILKICKQYGVQAMIEGPGHVPLHQIQMNMEVQESLCDGAPFYVLGPLVTDIAPGYDHITAAIGGAVAGMHGASFLCYVTPAEHLALPNADDVKDGIMAFKIAAHAADIARGIPNARDIDDTMAKARQVLDWEAQYACALDPERARSIRESRAPEEDHSETCSMCGKFCAVRSMNKALQEEYIDIL